MTSLVSVPRTAESLPGDLRRMLRERCTVDAVLASTRSEAGYDPGLWADLSSELGLPGLVVARSEGGWGLGLEAAGRALQEIGRSACPSPLLSSLIATWALANVHDTTELVDVLKAIASGRQRAAISLEPFGHPKIGPRVSSTAGRLSGMATNALDAEDADVLVVEAETCSGAALYLVDPAAAGVAVRRRDVPDRTRRLADLGFDSVCADWFAGPDTVARVRAVAALMVAFSQLGGVDACLDQALDSARSWSDYRRESESFRRMRTACADLFVEVESARTIVTAAAVAMDADAANAKQLAAVAKIRASRAYVRGAELGAQLLAARTDSGAEQPADLHSRRSRTDESLYGTPDSHRADIAQLLRLG